MPKLQYDKLQFSTQGRNLRISWDDAGEEGVVLLGNDIDELVDFLNSIRPVENNSRQAFRIPLTRRAELSTALNVDDAAVRVRPRNISMTGILVEFEGERWIDLPVGAELVLLMQLDGQPQAYGVVVKRRTRYGYGLFFSDSMPAGRVDPPTPLREIVMELQRRWTAGRVARGPSKDD